MGGRQTKNRPEDESTPYPTPEVNFEDFEVLRAIGKGTFGKVTLLKALQNHTFFCQKPIGGFKSVWIPGLFDRKEG